MDERAAIALCRQGDIRGLEYLVQVYELPAVRAAYLVVRDRALAEDVVQEAFLHAYERIHGFDPARPFGPWFLQSVVNRAIRAADRAAHSHSWDAATDAQHREYADGGADPLDQLAAAETRAAVWEALGRLVPEQRAVVVLRYYLDLSESEMATRLACPPGTVKSRLHAARRRLRRLLPAWVRGGAAPTDTISGGPAAAPLERGDER